MYNEVIIEGIAWQLHYLERNQIKSRLRCIIINIGCLKLEEAVKNSLDA